MDIVTICTYCSVVRIELNQLSLEITIHEIPVLTWICVSNDDCILHTILGEAESACEQFVKFRFRSIQQLVQFVHKETGTLMNWIVLRSQE